jgi:S1-C subfamily serine protease
VGPPAPRGPAGRDDEDDDAARIQKAPARARPAARLDDDHDDDAPRRRGRKDRDKGGASPALVWGLAGGVGVLVVGVCLLVWGLNRGKKDDDGPRAESPPAKEPWEKRGDDPRPAPGPDRPQDQPQRQPQPQQPDQGRGEGSLSREVLQRVKLATVYIRVETADGQRGSGSGFYEEGSRMVMTNAHVVGMLKAGSRPPRAVEVVFNPTGPTEKTFPSSVVAVDPLTDLALLAAPLMAEAPPLKIVPARDLIETQRVYVVGFPFGEKLNKSWTVSETSVSSLHKAADGVLSKVQVNGGMHPGNSGGPVIDARGNVVGVAVAGIEGTQINFAIPGEQVQGFLGGRLSGISLNTEVTPRDGKVLVPIRLDALDPLKKISKVEVDYWVAPPQPHNLPPSDRRADLGPANAARRTLALAYDAQTGKAQGSLPLDAMPSAGQVLWVQPVFTNAGGVTRWVAGAQYALTLPPDPRPAVLALRQAQGRVPVQLKSTANYRLEVGDEKSTYLQNIETRLIENTTTVGPGGARVLLTVDKFAIGLSEDGEAPETSRRFQEAVKRDVGGLVLDLQVAPSGELTSRRTDLSRVPQASREYLDSFGDQILQSFDTTVVPLPGGQLQPGQSWRGRRQMPLLNASKVGRQGAAVDMTYTYRGVRQARGRDVAVVDLSGSMTSLVREARVVGKVSGVAQLDLQTGVTLDVKALGEVTVSFRGGIGQAKGTLEVTLSREAAPAAEGPNRPKDPVVQDRPKDQVAKDRPNDPVAPDRPPPPDTGGRGKKIDPAEWVVQCNTGGWTDFPLTKMAHALKGDTLELTNNTGVGNHAGIVTRRRIAGDCTVWMQVRNAKSVGLKSAVGDGSWAATDSLEGGDWKTVVITRKQGKVTITVNGSPVRFLDVNSQAMGPAIVYIHVTANATAAVRQFEIEAQ